MTPHIEAKLEDIAKTVIMPGDPLRAKFIAETYLTDYKLINQVRGMLGYTGYYKNKQLTVMASGMGIPSMGIYSYELFKFYDVDTIIRVGSCGAYTNKLNLYDLVLVDKSFSDSNYAYTQNEYNKDEIESSKKINNQIIKVAKEKNIKINVGTIHCSEVFYRDNNPFEELYKNKKCLGVEMETFALFHNANIFNKNAACILTVSDSLVTKEATTSLERQRAFTEMIELALNSIL
ncbi:MAG: purine-nucleoside phosphorylase [Bacilli bacterium]|nr:purine-nucleoside phosphorylase [Bacilli bacterium]MDD4282687.1 purine-nucleoside phosphorylase [Bacilli bacterium]MDD4719093.1 purine-nucleoside phosphorylase [Bacilli bacterium]